METWEMEAKRKKWKRGCLWALVWGADEDREATVVVRRKGKTVSTA